jgi:hypothetical protein
VSSFLWFLWMLIVAFCCCFLLTATYVVRQLVCFCGGWLLWVCELCGKQFICVCYIHCFVSSACCFSPVTYHLYLCFCSVLVLDWWFVWYGRFSLSFCLIWFKTQLYKHLKKPHVSTKIPKFSRYPLFTSWKPIKTVLSRPLLICIPYEWVCTVIFTAPHWVLSI